MGLLRTLLKVGSMMDWATPVVNIGRGMSGHKQIVFTDGDMAHAERILKKHGGKGLDVTYDGQWGMMVPDENLDAAIRDLKRAGIL